MNYSYSGYLSYFLFGFLVVSGQSMATGQDYNVVLNQYDIQPATISFHPDDQLLISTSLNREDNSQYLLLVSNYLEPENAEIDTLPTNRPNRSCFSEGGKLLIYNTYDPIAKGWYTVKRKYEDGEFGVPHYLSEELDAPSMYYYWMAANGDFYTYLWFGRDSEEPSGLYVYKKVGDGYKKPELLLADGSNNVPFSPLIIDQKVLIFAQHGKEDDTLKGVYYMKYENGSWAKERRLPSIPYGYSFSFIDEETIGYLKGGVEIAEIPKNELLEAIERAEN